MLASLLLILTMVATPLATPLSVGYAPAWSYPLGSPSLIRPSVDEQRVYVAAGDGVITAFSIADGSVQWQAVPGELASAQIGVADGGILVPGVLGTLFLLDADTGRTITGQTLGATPLIQPLVQDDTLIVADESGTVHILDGETLRPRFQIVLGGDIAVPGALTGDIAVFTTDEGVVTAIDFSGGVVLWQAVLSAPAATRIQVLQGGDIVAGSEDGTVTRFAMEDGRIIWQQMVSVGYAVDTALTPDGLLVSTTDGRVERLDPDSGRMAWQQVVPGGATFAVDSCDEVCIVLVGDSLITMQVADGSTQPIAVIPGGDDGRIRSNHAVLVVVTGAGDVLVWNLQDAAEM